MTNNIINPFSDIALTFSGGGFRAAAFSLGTLSYLNRIHWKGDETLLQQVKVVSTVSGGTIAGIAYSESLYQKQHFNTFYKKLYTFLQHDTVLNKALEILEKDEVWEKSHKRRTLINAFSIAYHDLLTQATFAIFPMKPVGHLEEVIFNATEFTYANPFRFQNRGYLGNGIINPGGVVLEEIKSELFLSDILAASSCFPVGFEPIVFPHDFIPNDHVGFAKIIKDKRYETGIGLMDGGIVDNQGLSSILRAQDRRKNSAGQSPLFSLVLITDVASPYLEQWHSSEENFDAWKAQTINDFNWDVLPFFSQKTPWYIWLLTLLGAGGAAASFLPSISRALAMGLLIPSMVVITLGLGYIVGMPIIKKKLKQKAIDNIDKIVNMVPKFYRPFLKHFRSIKLGILERMLRERGSSAVSLLSDVFLKHVRRLNYNSIYKDADWNFKRIGNFVYELTEYDFKAKQNLEGKDNSKGFMQYADPELKQPGKLVQDSALIAAKMDTTLWFSKEHDAKNSLDNLIACGHYTTCYNLLIYLTELEHGDGSPLKGQRQHTPELNNLYDTLMKDWIAFKSNPLILVNPPSVIPAQNQDLE